jgi:hypothetical protein
MSYTPTPSPLPPIPYTPIQSAPAPFLSTTQMSSHSPPPFHLKIESLLAPGASRFFLLSLPRTIERAFHTINSTLYPRPDTIAPKIRSVTLVLRAFEGVAHTHGHRLDEMHKQIHLSTDYLSKIGRTDSAFIHEVEGVITHEMVHCL